MKSPARRFSKITASIFIPIMKSSKLIFPIIRTSTKHIFPLRHRDEIICKATLVDAYIKLVVDFEIRKAEDGKVCTRGRTEQVTVKLRKWKHYSAFQKKSAALLVYKWKIFCKNHLSPGWNVLSPGRIYLIPSMFFRLPTEIPEEIFPSALFPCVACGST